MREWWAPWNYRVSQKLVPVISCTITFDHNFIFTWNCKEMFIALSRTCIQKFINWHAPFVFISQKSFWSHCCVEWDTLRRATDDPDHFELFYHLVPWSLFNSQTIFFSIRRLKTKAYFGHLFKKRYSHPSPQWDFVPLYKFWDELIVAWFFWLLLFFFLTISKASSLHFSWTCFRLGLLTIVRASLLSFFFCI